MFHILLNGINAAQLLFAKCQTIVPIRELRMGYLMVAFNICQMQRKILNWPHEFKTKTGLHR